MRCERHPNNKETITTNPFAPPMCKACYDALLVPNKDNVVIQGIYFSDPEITWYVKRKNKIGPNIAARTNSRYERVMLGLPVHCQHHGEHTEFYASIDKGLYKSVRCRLCITDWAIRNRARAGKKSVSGTCDIHGEHDRFFMRYKKPLCALCHGANVRKGRV